MHSSKLLGKLTEIRRTMIGIELTLLKSEESRQISELYERKMPFL